MAYFDARTATILQGALASSIFKKLIFIPDEEDIEKSNIAIYTNDMPEAMKLTRRLANLLFLGVEVLMSIVLLWPHFGIVTFVAIAISAGETAPSFSRKVSTNTISIARIVLLKILTNYMPEMGGELDSARHERESLVKKLFFMIKEIKMTEREQIFHRIVSERRDAELAEYSQFYRLRAYRQPISKLHIGVFFSFSLLTMS